MKLLLVSAAASILTFAMPGCGARGMLSNPVQRAALWSEIAKDPAVAADLLDKLVASDSTRRVVVERIMANSEARQELMVQIARERTMLEGTLNIAVQDSTMRDHVLTLLRGMQMVGIK